MFWVRKATESAGLLALGVATYIVRTCAWDQRRARYLLVALLLLWVSLLDDPSILIKTSVGLLQEGVDHVNYCPPIALHIIRVLKTKGVIFGAKRCRLDESFGEAE
jgi:hypothetical protein